MHKSQFEDVLTAALMTTAGLSNNFFSALADFESGRSLDEKRGTNAPTKKMYLKRAYSRYFKTAAELIIFADKIRENGWDKPFEDVYIEDLPKPLKP